MVQWNGYETNFAGTAGVEHINRLTELKFSVPLDTICHFGDVIRS